MHVFVIALKEHETGDGGVLEDIQTMSKGEKREWQMDVPNKNNKTRIHIFS